MSPKGETIPVKCETCGATLTPVSLQIGKCPRCDSITDWEERRREEQPERMTDEEYQLVQSQLTLLIPVVDQLNLDGFIARINTAEAVGPVFNPTLYMKASDKLGKIKDLAEALLQFKREIDKQKREEGIDGRHGSGRR